MKQVIINKLQIFYPLILIIVLLSSIIMIVNGGFYRSFSNEQIVTQTENDDSFKELRKLDNVSKVEEDDKKVIFENSSLENVKSEISESELEDVSVYVLKALPISEILSDSFIIITSIILIVTFALYFILYRKAVKGSDNLYRLAIPTIVTPLLSVVIGFGLLSLLSLIYQIQRTDLFIPFAAIILVYFIISLKLSTVSITSSKEEFLVNLRDELVSIGITLSIVEFTLLIPILFALGPIFLFPALAFIIVSACIVISFTVLIDIQYKLILSQKLKYTHSKSSGSDSKKSSKITKRPKTTIKTVRGKARH